MFVILFIFQSLNYIKKITILFYFLKNIFIIFLIKHKFKKIYVKNNLKNYFYIIKYINIIFKN
jgi:hypothetical protein